MTKEAVPNSAVPSWKIAASVAGFLLVVLAAVAAVLYPRGRSTDEILEEYRPSAEAMMAMKSGMDVHAQGNRSAARQLYRQATRSDPHLALAELLIGLSYLDESRDPEALNSLNTELDLPGWNAWRLNARGVAYARQKRYEEAIREFTAAAELNDGYVLAVHNRAMARHASGDLDGALADTEWCISTDPNWHFPYLTQGVIYSQRGEYDKAEASFTRGLECKPVSRQVLANRIRLRRAIGDTEGAAADLKWDRELKKQYGE